MTNCMLKSLFVNIVLTVPVVGQLGLCKERGLTSDRLACHPRNLRSLSYRDCSLRKQFLLTLTQYPYDPGSLPSSAN